MEARDDEMGAATRAMSVRAEELRVVLEDYLRGAADPGDGVLASTLVTDEGSVTQTGVRWQAAYSDGGVAQVDPTAWLLGAAMLARTMINLRARQAPITPQYRAPDDVRGPTVASVSLHGFTVWLSQGYLLEIDRYLVGAVVTWDDAHEREG